MLRPLSPLFAVPLAVLVISLAAACGGPAEDAPGATPGPPVRVDRIVYVGDDGNVHTVNPDGTVRRQHTFIEGRPVASLAVAGLAQAPSSYYAWPTWSPDGSRLAASRVVNEGTSRDAVDLRVIDLSTTRESVVYASPPGQIGFVAQRAPHYPYWSPDSRRLAFLASGAAGLTLYVADAERENSAKEVVSGAPLYFAWSADGGAVLHVRDKLLLASDLGEDAPGEQSLAAGAFRAPSFSHDGRRMAYVDAGTEGGLSLYTAEAGGENPAPAADVEGQAAFLWSPVDGRIAYADAPHPRLALFTRLTVVDTSTGAEVAALDDLVLAFFWSPDGSRLAYVVVDEGGEWLVWKIAALDGSTPRELARFLPSQDTFIMLGFFDQYAHSHAVWSPDGSRLVFAGRVPEPDGTVRSGDRVIVLDTEGIAEPRVIGDGTAAFWSWR